MTEISNLKPFLVIRYWNLGIIWKLGFVVWNF